MQYLNETGVIVTNVTCDNAASNITALTLLGAKLSKFEELKVTLNLENMLQVPIFVILDTCHLMKLVRGTFHDMQLLFTTKGEKICWNFLKKLVDVQTVEGLHFANKLSKEHNHYKRMKMKVYLCTQLLSESVASAIQFCEEKLHHPEFVGTEATCEFLRQFNVIFDVLDSKSVLGKFTKAPMRQSNYMYWQPIFNEIKEYIPKLLHMDPNGEAPSNSKRQRRQNRVIDGPRKKGFLGFLVNVTSMENIFKCFVQTGHLKYILGHKLSQDHLELFFMNVRTSLGSNNNPTVLQFTSAYRKLLVGATSVSYFGNCLMQDDTNVLVLPQKVTDKKLFEIEDEETEKESKIFIEALATKSEYRKSILIYISGFIQRRLIRDENCVECGLLLSNLRIVKSSGLIDIKDRGGLVRPSPAVVKVVSIAHSIYFKSTYS